MYLIHKDISRLFKAVNTSLINCSSVIPTLRFYFPNYYFFIVILITSIRLPTFVTTVTYTEVIIKI